MMSDQDHNQHSSPLAMPRREFLKKAAVVGGGALAMSQFSGLKVFADHVPGHTGPHEGNERPGAAGHTGDMSYDANRQIEAREFPNLTTVEGLSTRQIEEHLGLYRGYVGKINYITEQIRSMEPDIAEVNPTYHPYRELHVEQTYALNGVVLHEYYFENLGNPGGQPGPLFREFATKEFGSWDAFRNHFLATGKAMRGWAMTGFSMRDRRIHNYGLDTHNIWTPVDVIPLLVLDVYEHAYMIDYGTNRGTYLDVFWRNVDWNVVEDRLRTMVFHYDRTTAPQA